MMIRRATALSFLLVGLLAIVQAAPAQEVALPGVAVAGTIGALSVSPEFDSREWGISYEGAIRYTWPSGFQLQAGVSYSLVDPEEVQGIPVPSSIKEKREVLNVFVDPRLVLNMGESSFAPYVGARVGYLHHSYNLPGSVSPPVLPATINGSGWIIAGNIGLLVRLSHSLAVEVNGQFGVAPLGDIKVDDGNVEDTIADSGTSTFTGAIRAGLSYTIIPGS
ncbi:MAG: outer membrane beta-barrel protein [Gemmatimonadota bacterium]|nr:MAG: outer membrane beta-barrel protein [Gemmatimonadota bacterium]